MPNQLTFGLLGAGRMARAYAEALQHCEHACLSAVTDVRRTAAQALATTFGCQSYDSLQTMLAHRAVEAVIICTPPVTHPDLCIACCGQQIHVLCEKPFSIDLTSAQNMVAAAQESGVLLTMAAPFRYVEDVIRAKSLVLSGALGELILCENVFTARLDMTLQWPANPLVSGGGVLRDYGPHGVDLLDYFLGPLAIVQAVEGQRSQGLMVEESVHVCMRSHNGIMGSMDLSWSMDKDQGSYLHLYGSRGTVTVGWQTSRYRLSSGGDWVVFGQGYHQTEVLRRQLENFALAVRGLEPLCVTATDALACVQMIEMTYAALQGSRGMAPGITRTAALGDVVTPSLAAGQYLAVAVHPAFPGRRAPGYAVDGR